MLPSCAFRPITITADAELNTCGRFLTCSSHLTPFICMSRSLTAGNELRPVSSFGLVRASLLTELQALAVSFRPCHYYIHMQNRFTSVRGCIHESVQGVTVLRDSKPRGPRNESLCTIPSRACLPLRRCYHTLMRTAAGCHDKASPSACDDSEHRKRKVRGRVDLWHGQAWAELALRIGRARTRRPLFALSECLS